MVSQEKTPRDMLQHKMFEYIFIIRGWKDLKTFTTHLYVLQVCFLVKTCFHLRLKRVSLSRTTMEMKQSALSISSFPIGLLHINCLLTIHTSLIRCFRVISYVSKRFSPHPFHVWTISYRTVAVCTAVFCSDGIPEYNWCRSCDWRFESPKLNKKAKSFPKQAADENGSYFTRAGYWMERWVSFGV